MLAFLVLADGRVWLCSTLRLGVRALVVDVSEAQGVEAYG